VITDSRRIDFRAGLRNSMSERFGWCHPTEGLLRVAVELRGDGIELVIVRDTEIGARGDVMASQPVGVDGEPDVLGHLLASVPGERQRRVLRQGRDVRGEFLTQRSSGLHNSSIS
jgi:hypothetical protein